MSMFRGLNVFITKKIRLFIMFTTLTAGVDGMDSMY